MRSSLDTSDLYNAPQFIRLLLEAMSTNVSECKRAFRALADQLPDDATWEGVVYGAYRPQLWIGRSGRIEGTPEWVVKQTPYLLVQAIESDLVQYVHALSLTICHCRTNCAGEQRKRLQPVLFF
jgi:hypothetical protein